MVLLLVLDYKKLNFLGKFETKASEKRNDHFADQNGNVYQRDQKGDWQEKRNNSSWSRSKSSTGQPTQPNRSSTQNRQKLE